MHWLQKRAMAFFVLSLSRLIFFILVSDRQTRNSVLRPTLELLGEQLFAAVGDEIGKEQLRADYREFMREAEEQAIDSAKVEKIAVDFWRLKSRAHSDPNPNTHAAHLRHEGRCNGKAVRELAALIHH